MHVSNALAVEFQTSVISAAGKVVKQGPVTRNLILDCGLDKVAVALWRDMLGFIVVGTGTTPTKRDSGAITFTAAAGTITASAGFFAADDVGRVLKMDSGAELRITGYTSATEATTSNTSTQTSSEGTVWYVNETTLTTPFLWFNEIITKSDTRTDNVMTFDRTVQTPVFTETKTLKEIGWTPHNRGTLFGRALIPNGGDTVEVGQKYRVRVKLLVAISPTTIQTQADVGNNGFSVAGTWALEEPDGALTAHNRFHQPCQDLDVFIGASAPELAPMSGYYYQDYGISGYGVVASRDGYVPGSCEIYRTVTLATGQANSSNWRSIHLSGLRILLANPQTKDDLHTLTLRSRVSWSRTLVN